MTTAAGLLATIAIALYGRQFQIALAEDLGVSDRQVRRWLAGQFDPPLGVWRDLAAICKSRRDTLAELAKAASEAAMSAG